MIEPRHRFESVIEELREGLQSGSVVLDSADPAPSPSRSRARILSEVLMATSKTTKDSFTLENLFGIGGHHKTTISDGKRRVEGLGRTAEKSQKVASEKWDKRKGK